MGFAGAQASIRAEGSLAVQALEGGIQVTKRRPVKVVLLLCLLLLGYRLHATEPGTLTLSCDGTVKSALSDDSKPEVITKMGVLVDLANGTVLGFSPDARIKSTNAVTVEFEGKSSSGTQFTPPGRFLTDVHGTIDRITGSVDATTSHYDKATDKIISLDRWELQCKPVKRVF